jgi:hypothetical protein
MLRSLLLAAAFISAVSASISDERTIFRSALTRRGAAAASSLGLAAGRALPPRAAARALAETLAEHTLRKRERLMAAKAAGALGDVRVNTSYGAVIGIGGGNASVNQFLGVPFAE